MSVTDGVNDNGFEYHSASALGQIPGTSVNFKFGYNSAVSTTELTIYQGATTIYTYPAAATVMQVSSTSTTDASAGTGARTTYIEGLDTNYREISETVTMNGQTQVATVNSYLRINRSYITTAGTTAVNNGTIRMGTGTATAGVPGVTYALLASGDGQTLQALYTVPAVQQALLTHVSVTSARNTATGYITWRLMSRGYGAPYRCRSKFDTIAAGGNIVLEYSDSPIVFASGTDVEMRAVGSEANNACSAQMALTLVPAG